MIKLPDDVVYALVRLKSTLAQCNRLNYCSGALHELEQAIRLNATAQPVSEGWVKCSERMPDNGEWCICFAPNCFVRRPALYWVDELELWTDGSQDFYRHNITHWTPLPAAPGGQDD